MVAAGSEVDGRGVPARGGLAAVSDLERQRDSCRYRVVAELPFGPWREARGEDRRGSLSRPLAGTVRDRWAVLYDACAQARLGDPETVRNNLLWRIAAALGANRSDEEQERTDPRTAAQKRLAAQNAGDVPDWLRAENENGVMSDTEFDSMIGAGR